MNLQGIVAVSGKPGLWKALAQNRTGYILESLDGQKTKMVANISTAKLASLAEITIFGADDDMKLTDIFENMKAAKSIPDTNADGKAMRLFFREVAPDHDEERVYASDMKKIIGWYTILKDLPVFNEEPATLVAEEEKAVEEPVNEEPAAEVATKKTPKPKKKK